MLILRRKVGETLQISDNITVTVLDVYDGGVRLAIEAPKDISILRGELLRAVDANRDAAASQPTGVQKLLNLDANRDAAASRSASVQKLLNDVNGIRKKKKP